MERTLAEYAALVRLEERPLRVHHPPFRLEGVESSLRLLTVLELRIQAVVRVDDVTEDPQVVSLAEGSPATARYRRPGIACRRRPSAPRRADELPPARPDA